MRKQYDDHTHVHAPEVHTWDKTTRGGRERVLFLVLFLRFRLQFLLRAGAEQLHQAAGIGTEERGHDTLGRPRNSFWWLVILIFLVLCQTGRASYLCDQPDRPTRRERLGFFFWSWFGLLASRRYCGNDVGDGTSCSNSNSSTERYRSCSVSIQTVVLSKPSSVAEAVLPCPNEWCMLRWDGVVCRSVGFFQRDAFVPNLPASYVPGTGITAHKLLSTAAIASSAQFRH